MSRWSALDKKRVGRVIWVVFGFSEKGDAVIVIGRMATGSQIADIIFLESLDLDLA